MGKEARLEMRPSNRAFHGNLKHGEYNLFGFVLFLKVFISISPKFSPVL